MKNPPGSIARGRSKPMTWERRNVPRSWICCTAAAAWAPSPPALQPPAAARYLCVLWDGSVQWCVSLENRVEDLAYAELLVPRGARILHVGPILLANQDHRLAGAPPARQIHIGPDTCAPIPVPAPACATQETQPHACEPGRLCGRWGPCGGRSGRDLRALGSRNARKGIRGKVTSLVLERPGAYGA